MCPNISDAAGRLESQSYGYLVQGSQDSIRGLFMLISAPIAGRVSDHFGRKPVLFFSLLFLAVPPLALALSCRTGVYLPLYIVSGIFESSATVSANAYIAVTVQSNDSAKSNVFAQLYGIPVLSMLIGGPLGGLAAHTWRESRSDVYFSLIAALYTLPPIFTLLFVSEPRCAGTVVGAEPASCSLSSRDNSVPTALCDQIALTSDRSASLNDPVIHEETGSWSCLSDGGLRCMGADYEEQKDEAGRGIRSRASPEGPERRNAAPDQALDDTGWRKSGVLLGVAFLLSMENAGVTSLLFMYLAARFPECTEDCRGAMLSALAAVWGVSNLLLLPPTLRRLGPLATLRLSLAANAAHCMVYAAATAMWPVAANLALVALSAFSHSVLRAIAAASVPAGRAGALLGSLEAASAAAAVVAPLLFAEAFRIWVRAAHGPAPTAAAHYPGAPFVLGAAFAAAALLLTAALPPRPAGSAGPSDVSVTGPAPRSGVEDAMQRAGRVGGIVGVGRAGGAGGAVAIVEVGRGRAAGREGLREPLMGDGDVTLGTE